MAYNPQAQECQVDFWENHKIKEKHLHLFVALSNLVFRFSWILTVDNLVLMIKFQMLSKQRPIQGKLFNNFLTRMEKEH